MDRIPKIKPEITLTAENEHDFDLLCSRLREMPFDSATEITERKKFYKVTIGNRDYHENWYLQEVLDDFMPRLSFWNDGSFLKFCNQSKIKLGLCIVVYQYGTYPGMSIDGNTLSMLHKFNGSLDIDIYKI